MNRIRELREARNWKQSELGRYLNCTGASISRYELGQHDLDTSTINALCDLFGVTADYLLCRSSVPTPAVSEEDAALLRAYHAADARSRAAIDALLAPLPQEESRSAG